MRKIQCALLLLALCCSGCVYDPGGYGNRGYGYHEGEHHEEYHGQQAYGQYGGWAR